MSSEDLDKTVLAGPDASPDGADADPDATVLAEPPAEDDPDATVLADPPTQTPRSWPTLTPRSSPTLPPRASISRPARTSWSPCPPSCCRR